VLVYEEDKTTFLQDVQNNVIDKKIGQQMFEKLHKRVGDREKASWMNSLNYMQNVLLDDDIPSDSGIAIEFKIPNNEKRVDFIISGLDEQGRHNAIIIELKQWSAVRPLEDVEQILVMDPKSQIKDVQTYLGRGIQKTPHPSYQAASYQSFIVDYNANVQEIPINVNSCAYLHNYYKKEPVDPLFEPHFSSLLQKTPLFCREDVIKLKSFIKKYIKKGDKRETLYYIDKGDIRPSKSLQDALSSMLKNNEEFVLIDEQKVVYEEILALSKKGHKDKVKRVFIIKGGPGTGKTVVAINLLVAITNSSQVCAYVTKNSAPRNVFIEKLAQNQDRNISNLFKSSVSFIDSKSNEFTTLIVDESHRLNQRSQVGTFIKGEDQVKELINASLTTVFFIDEKQIVTAKDYGTKAIITKWANHFKAKIIEGELLSQFRCGGSDGYLEWLDYVLGITNETANPTLEGIDYDFKIIESPSELRAIIEEKNKIDNKSRLVAGYCWEWSSKKNPSVNDIEIENLSMQWNLANDNTYAISENSINQIGCIHTTQGLEFSYVGVIIGDDLRYENKKVITDYNKRAKSDKSLHGLLGPAKKGDKEAADAIDTIIRNTYRTLLSRGLKGCYVYCTDVKLAAFLKKRTGKYQLENPVSAKAADFIR